MPHIFGHVEDGVSSCGILSLSDEKEKDQNNRKGLFFVPPNFDVKDDSEVEFHLLEIPTEGGPILIAYDLIEKTLEEKKWKVVNPTLAMESDKKYKLTGEYKRYYKDKSDHKVKPDPEIAVKNIRSVLKTVGELRRIKKSCEVTSYFFENGKCPEQ